MAIEYYKGAELPNVDITWLDSDGNVINFSSGYTFTVKVGTSGQAAILTKTSGITGLAAAPNIVIAWTTDELNITPGAYDLDIIARETATSKDRIQSTDLIILSIVA